MASTWETWRVTSPKIRGAQEATSTTTRRARGSTSSSMQAEPAREKQPCLSIGETVSTRQSYSGAPWVQSLAALRRWLGRKAQRPRRWASCW